MSFLNSLPWRRRKIEAVRRVLDPPRLGPLSSESLEALMVAIVGLRDTRGLRVHLNPREVLSTDFIEQNLIPLCSNELNTLLDTVVLAPRNQAVTWLPQKKTRP